MRTIRPARRPDCLLMLLFGALTIASCGKPADGPVKGRAAAPEVASRHFPFSHDPVALERSGPATCAECHREIYEKWRTSHHALANRPISAAVDRAAFQPARSLRESGVTYQLEEREGRFILRVTRDDGSAEEHALTGVIGHTPIRQYLADFPGGRLQTISPSYDVFNDRWIDVFAGEDRLPGEWGHWTGQGMNWNANCAYCHTTAYEKNFDFEANAYDSRWIQQGIACAECHTGLENHAHAARLGDKDPPADTFSPQQVLDNCARCHSRRDQLTANAFVPGDAYHDHFSVSGPDQPGLYHADGQILDEVFVHASFGMSRMAHAGVTCLDCHDPHSMEHILPVENNALCMRCHGSGHLEAPVIEPAAHSFHPPDSSGNRCVECHMPKTRYMQVDPRADHGFHSPDPLMTRELGIPNACSRCHDDKDLAWNIEWAEKWYGEKLATSRQRARARAIAAAHALEPEGARRLLDLAAAEDIPFWQATYARLLGNYLMIPEAVEHLENALEDPDPLVRERALLAIGPMPASEAAARRALKDPSRSVRIAASRILSGRGQPNPEERARAEWQAHLRFNADRPQSLLMMANETVAAGKSDQVGTLVDRAISLDRRSPAVYQQAAVLLSLSGHNQRAEEVLLDGRAVAPRDPYLAYYLALLRAEQNRLKEAITLLEETVTLEPAFQRAWYNLALAYQKEGRTAEAEIAMRRARGEAPPEN